MEQDCFWFEKYFWWRNTRFRYELKCDIGTEHLNLEKDTVSNIEAIHQLLLTVFSQFCLEIFHLGMSMDSISKWC